MLTGKSMPPANTRYPQDEPLCGIARLKSKRYAAESTQVRKSQQRGKQHGDTTASQFAAWRGKSNNAAASRDRRRCAASWRRKDKRGANQHDGKDTWVTSSGSSVPESRASWRLAVKGIQRGIEVVKENETGRE